MPFQAESIAPSSPSRLRRRPLWLGLLLLTLTTLLSAQASATFYGGDTGRHWGGSGEWDHDADRDHPERGGWPHGHGFPGWGGGDDDRLTLYDLVVGGETFESANGKVSFSNFDAELGRHGDRALRRYKVEPTRSGFALTGPVFSILGHGPDLALSYDVEADEGLQVEKVILQVTGFGLLGKSGARMLLSEEGGDEVGKLFATGRSWPRHRSDPRDRLVLDDPLVRLTVEEKIFAKGLFAKNMKTEHTFKTGVVPEPGTAILFALGLTGLAASARRWR